MDAPAQTGSSTGALAGKVALVTGAGQGVGQGIALALAAEGVHLAVLGRTAAKLEANCDLVRERGVRAHGRSGLNVWLPVPDETVVITRLLAAGWAAAPGARFRIGTPPGIRVTIADLRADEVDPLADALAEAALATGRRSV